jgi:predicted DNA-binding transcriptional regulator AlpA
VRLIVPLETAPPNILSDYLTKRDLAEQLGRSVRTVDRMALNGDGPPPTPIGRTTLYRRDAVLEWLREREIRRPARASSNRGTAKRMRRRPVEDQ